MLKKKLLYKSLTDLQGRVRVLEQSLRNMLRGLEQESLDWSSCVDHFAVIASELAQIKKLLADPMCSPLREYTLVPTQLSFEQDEDLIQMTEGRVSTFSHDVVPLLLHTKPSFEDEDKLNAAKVTEESALETKEEFNTTLSSILDMVSMARRLREEQSSPQQDFARNNDLADTQVLLAAVSVGKGLKEGREEVAEMQPMDTNDLAEENKSPPPMKFKIRSGVRGQSPDC